MKHPSELWSPRRKHLGGAHDESTHGNRGANREAALRSGTKAREFLNDFKNRKRRIEDGNDALQAVGDVSGAIIELEQALERLENDPEFGKRAKAILLRGQFKGLHREARMIASESTSDEGDLLVPPNQVESRLDHIVDSFERKAGKSGFELIEDVKGGMQKGKHFGGPALEVKKFIPLVHREEQTITKQDGTQERRRLIYGVVYEPFTVDAQGDWATPETIEEAAHKFLMESRKMRVMHKLNADRILPVESYIAPQDFQLGRTLVRKGSWVLVSKVLDEEIWKAVESGQLRGYSLGGRSSVRNGEAPPR